MGGGIGRWFSGLKGGGRIGGRPGRLGHQQRRRTEVVRIGGYQEKRNQQCGTHSLFVVCRSHGVGQKVIDWVKMSSARGHLSS
jgi:hypothetical protein